MTEKEVVNKEVVSRPKPKGRLTRARKITLLVVFASIVVGLFVGFGWGTLSSLGFGVISYLCPIGALETLLASKTFIPRIVIALAVVVIVVALVGRLFCSWVCPVPPVTHFFHPEKKNSPHGEIDTDSHGEIDADSHGGAEADSFSETGVDDVNAATHAEEIDVRVPCVSCAQAKVGGCAGHAVLPPVGGKRDGLQLDSRHGVLIGALISSLVCGFPVFCLICPVGLTIALVIAVYSAVFEHNPTMSLLIIVVILLIEVVFFRKWCHTFCPIGAFMSLVGSHAPVLKPRVDKEKCLREQGVDCRVCVTVCPEELDPHSKRIPECTRCGACVDACPVHAIHVGAAANHPKCEAAPAPESHETREVVPQEGVLPMNEIYEAASVGEYRDKSGALPPVEP